jgi:uncharacterized protein DUF4129
MAQRQQPHPARVGAVAVLVALVVLAARARAEGAAPPRVAGPVGAVVIDLLGALCVAVLVAGSVLLVWAGWARGMRVAPAVGRRRPPPMSPRRRVLVAALLGVLVALGVLLLTRPYPVPGPDRPATAPDRRVVPPGQHGVAPGAPVGGTDPAPAHQVSQGPVGYVIALALLASALALAVVLLRRGRVPVSVDGAAPELAVAMASAVAAGRVAVRDGAITDPRRAIVACFAAMEEALARLGGEVAPRAADTPEEVITRGLAGARVPEQPARALLELFREARFSAHPMRAADREAADQALAVILTALNPNTVGAGGPR